MTGKTEVISLTALLGAIAGSDESKQEVMLVAVAMLAGISSFILMEDEKTFASFMGEIVVGFFSGYVLGKAGAEILELSESQTVAIVALLAFLGRQVLLGIKKKLPDLITEKIENFLSKK